MLSVDESDPRLAAPISRRTHAERHAEEHGHPCGRLGNWGHNRRALVAAEEKISFIIAHDGAEI